MKKVFIIHTRLVDGTGSPAIEDGMIVYETPAGEEKGSKIIYAGEMDYNLAETASKEDKVLDFANNYTVTPGLINTHVHLDLQMPGAGFRLDPLGPAYRALKSYRRAAEALDCGVTTIRNVGGGDYYDVAIRKAVTLGMLNGPRILTCGGVIMAHGGHGYADYGAIECTGRVQFMEETRNHLAHGVDMIKLGLTGGLEGATEGLCDRQVSNEEIEAVIWAAHAAGKKVAAHLSDDTTIRESVLLGLDSVEHGYAMSEETAELLAEKGAFYTPTLCVSSEDGVQYMLQHGFPERNIQKSYTAVEGHRAAARYAHKHGVKVCIGTDMVPSDPTISGANATVREMELLNQYGEFTPLETIRAATATGAELCGLSNVTGILREGLEADIIAVKGKPDMSISDMRNLSFVVKGGGLVWSAVPCLNERNFNVVSEGCKMAGGTFCNF